MQAFINERKNETVRLIQFLAKHSKIQWKLTQECELNAQECLKIIKILEENHFYEMIYILLLKNQHDRIIGNAFEKLADQMWANELEHLGADIWCVKVKEFLNKEIEDTGKKLPHYV